MLRKLVIPILFFLLTLVYLFPLLHGLILLPVDLLISNYLPWYSPGTILLKNPYMQDSILQLFPWRHLVFQSLSNGILPLWNPYQFLGMPFMAILKPMVFYPLNIFFLFGEVRAWNMVLFSQLLLGMLFAYYLARDFRIKILPSMLTSLAFGLNSYMIGLLQFGSDAHTLIWFPLLLLFVKRYLDNQKNRYLFLTIITLALSIFAGQLQYLAYFIMFLAGFILLYGRSLKTSRFHYIKVFLSIALGFGISAIQLLPSIELFLLSHRGLLSPEQSHDLFSSTLMAPFRHLRLLSPDFFGNPISRDSTWGYIEGGGYFGIIPLFFALFAMIYARKKQIIKIFSLAFLGAFFFSLQGVGEILYLLKIPIITSGSADRITTVLLFSGALLAGFGISEFIDEARKRRFVSLIVYVVTIALLIVGYALFLQPSTATVAVFFKNIKFSLLILSGFFVLGLLFSGLEIKFKKNNILTVLFLLVVSGLTFFDLFRMGYRFLTFSNHKFIYPEMEVTQFLRKDSQQTLGRTYGIAEPELGTYLNIYTIESYNPLYPARTSVLLQNLQYGFSKPLTKDNKYFLTTKEDQLKHTLDFLGTKYIVATIAENPSTKFFETDKFQNDFTKIFSDERYAVFENSKAYPRFGLFYSTQTFTKDDEILAAINNKDLDLRKTILLEEDLPLALTGGTGSASLESTTLNTQQFQIITDKPALFYISDTHFPGWLARINGEPTKIYRANYNFRAVLVPAGQSVLSFFYQPMSFIAGIGISLASALLSLVLVAVKQKQKPKKSKKAA